MRFSFCLSLLIFIIVFSPTSVYAQIASDVYQCTWSSGGIKQDVWLTYYRNNNQWVGEIYLREVFSPTNKTPITHYKRVLSLYDENHIVVQRAVQSIIANTTPVILADPRTFDLEKYLGLYGCAQSVGLFDKSMPLNPPSNLGAIQHLGMRNVGLDETFKQFLLMPVYDRILPQPTTTLNMDFRYTEGSVYELAFPVTSIIADENLNHALDNGTFTQAQVNRLLKLYDNLGDGWTFGSVETRGSSVTLRYEHQRGTLLMIFSMVFDKQQILMTVKTDPKVISTYNGYWPNNTVDQNALLAYGDTLLSQSFDSGNHWLSLLEISSADTDESNNTYLIVEYNGTESTINAEIRNDPFGLPPTDLEFLPLWTR